MTGQQDLDKRIQGIGAALMLDAYCVAGGLPLPPIPANLTGQALADAMAANEAILIKQWERFYLFLASVQKDETTLPTPDAIVSAVASADPATLQALVAKLAPLLGLAIPGAAPAVSAAAGILGALSSAPVMPNPTK